MINRGHVGPPRLLSSEVIPSTQDKDNPTEPKHCTLRINVENKSKDEPTQYDIDLQPSTLETLLESFDKIKNQLHLLTEREAKN